MGEKIPFAADPRVVVILMSPLPVEDRLDVVMTPLANPGTIATGVFYVGIGDTNTGELETEVDFRDERVRQILGPNWQGL